MHETDVTAIRGVTCRCYGPSWPWLLATAVTLLFALRRHCFKATAVVPAQKHARDPGETARVSGGGFRGASFGRRRRSGCLQLFELSLHSDDGLSWRGHLERAASQLGGVHRVLLLDPHLSDLHVHPRDLRDEVVLREDLHGLHPASLFRLHRRGKERPHLCLADAYPHAKRHEKQLRVENSEPDAEPEPHP